MSVETTVLLLEVDSLPSSLEEQLTKRDVLVEQSTVSEVHQMLPVVVPDLVVQSGDLDLGPVLESISKEKTPVPLVVIAARGTIRRLRAEKHEAIKALIPKDLPIAAVAHRLSTMARRSAEGRPLEQTQRRASAKAGRDAAPGPAPNPPAKSPTSERGSLAPVPLAPQQDIKIVDSDPEVQKQIDEEERERKAMEELEAQERAVAEARRKKQAEADDATRRAAEKREAEIEQRALARKKKLAEQRRAAEKKREAAKKKVAEKAAGRAKTAPKPPRAAVPANSPSEVKALDELFPTEQDTAAVPAASMSEEELVEEHEQTTQAVDISAFAPTLDEQARRASDTPPKPGEKKPPSKPPRSSRSAKPAVPSSSPTRRAEDKDGFEDVKKNDELSVIAPLPVNMRMELAPQTEKLPAIRMALLDTDLTRADAVSAALREIGVKIHPITPDTSKTRWPMLRRFAPQGLVVDEKSMARGASEWVETFRGDPFLRHVPVVLVRFSRLFDESSGQVTLDPLLHLTEHLGREEFALLSKLGPGRQVDLWLSQVAPYRLVEMLTREDRNTRLDCKSRTERMVWHLGPGYAGKGKLADLKTNEPKERLNPEDAMLWLLGHEDCQIAVHEHAEPLAHPSESKDAEELLREMTQALAAPTRHESVNPPAQSPPSSGGAHAPSVPQSAFAQTMVAAPGTEVPHLSSSELISEAADPTTPTAPPPPQRAPQESPVALPVSRKPLLSPERKQKFVEAWARAQSAVRSLVETYRQKATTAVTPLEGRVPPKLLEHAYWLVPLALLCVVALVIVVSSGDAAPEDKEPVAVGEPAEAPGPQPKPTKPPAPKEEEPKERGESDEKPAKEDTPSEASLWKVAPDAKLPSCEEQLGPSAPKSEDPIKSVGYWKKARQLLMVGKTDEAIENMCLAGLFDPAGPASEGLAEYYLGQRSLAEAERWIRASLKADPDRRKSQELLGDIENQKGNVEESKKLLLDTMRLTGDETKKMELTARKLKQDAALARKGGDLPRAERELRRAVLLAPENAVLAGELAEILLRRKAPDAAMLWAAHSLKLDPNYSVAKLLSGRIAEAQGKKDEARTFYEMVPIGDPFHKEAQRRRNRL